MDAALKEKWISNLESDEFRQAHGEFKDSTGAYCCLGLLCFTADVEPSHPIFGDNYDFVETTIGGPAINPESSLDEEDNVVHVLWNLNDTYNWSFREIAEWVRHNIPTTENGE